MVFYRSNRQKVALADQKWQYLGSIKLKLCCNLQEAPTTMNMNRLIGRTFTRHQHSFAKLFRESEFVKMGDMNGHIIKGKVVHRVGKDLYIDFGYKFNAVCKTPIKDSNKYFIGSEVMLKLYDTELSERFLGSRYDLTLLEADADIIGIRKS